MGYDVRQVSVHPKIFLQTVLIYRLKKQYFSDETQGAPLPLEPTKQMMESETEELLEFPLDGNDSHDSNSILEGQITNTTESP